MFGGYEHGVVGWMVLCIVRLRWGGGWRGCNVSRGVVDGGMSYLHLVKYHIQRNGFLGGVEGAIGGSSASLRQWGSVLRLDDP